MPSSNGRKSFRIARVQTRVLATGADTGGAYSVIEQEHPPLTGAPLHHHRNGPESFCVLAGEYTFLVGTARRRLAAGEFLLVPAGVPHAFVNRGGTPARLLILLPAGTERYFELMAEITGDDPERQRKLAALDARYGIVLLPHPNEAGRALRSEPPHLEAQRPDPSERP
jgi:quercetin dioxygenase-like cupin family protein